MEGFIITTHYEVIKDLPVIKLFGRLKDGKSFQANVNYLPYFFIKKSDEKKANEIIPLIIEESQLKNMNGEEVSKITLQDPKKVSELRKILEDHDIACFEADIRFTMRWLIDNDILSAIKIEGKSEKGKYTDLLYENPKITPSKDYPEPTMLSFDIETDAKMTEIISLSLYMQDYEEVIIVDNGVLGDVPKYTSIVPDERTLITTFLERVRKLDPDIIVGWNVIDFDLKLLIERAKHHNIAFVLGRDDSATTLRLESSFFRDSSVNCKGRIVLDGIQLLRSSFVKLNDYKLNTAAKHFLGEGKLIQEDNRFTIIDEMYTKDPIKLIKYNLKDSKLVYDLLLESKVFQLTVQRSLLVGLHMDNVKASIASFDSLYLRELRKIGLVANSTRPTDRDSGLGGFVMTSKPGIYTNVLVLDFKSLYPSLMRTFNIDPVAYVGQGDNGDYTDKDKYIIAPNWAVFENGEGILPKMLETLWGEREKVRKEGNELARYAIKILMNSMYGVLASPNSRFHIRNLSNAITYFAQHFIKMTAKVLQEKGYEVIYGDTDSVFVNVKTTDVLESNKIGKQIESELNEYMKEHVKEKYHRESVLELEFEKLYTKFFMPKVRGSDVGAKKRYAGKKVVNNEKIVEEKEPETVLDFTGLEFVRRDWTEVSKEFQLNLLDLIFADKSVEEFVKTFVNDLKEGKYDELLVYRKSLRKDVSAYTKTTPPHVKAAKLLDKIDGNIISYVITKDGPQPIEKQTSPLDYEHYIDKQIKPIANSVLELQGSSFEDVMKGSSQSGLGDFF